MNTLDKYRGTTLGSGVQVTTALTPEQEQKKQELLTRTPVDTVQEDALTVSDVGIADSSKQSLLDYTPDRADAIGYAFTEDNLIGSVTNWVGDKLTMLEASPDPEFDLRDHKYAYELVGAEFWDEINGAVSEEHLGVLVDKYARITKQAEHLDDLGIEGTAYRMGAFLGDVPFITAIQKLNSLGKLGTSLNTLDKSYAGRALVAGTVEGSFEATKQALSPTERTELDLILAVGLGGSLGGLYNPSKYSEGVGDALANVAKEQVQEVANKGKITIPERIRNVVENSQINVVSMFKKAPSATMQRIGDELFLDPLRPTTEFKATESQIAVIDGVNSAFANTFNPIMLDYMKTMYNIGSIKSRFAMEKQNEFFEVVGKLYYGDDALRQSLPPEMVAKIDGAITKMSQQSHDILSRNGHEMFAEGGQIARKDDYMPRKWDRIKIKEALATGKFTRLDFAQAVASGLKGKLQNLSTTITDEEILLAAQKFVQNVTKEHAPVGNGGYLSHDNTFKTVIEELKDVAKLSDEQVGELEYIFTQQEKASAKNTASATRSRADLDLDASYTNPETGAKVVLKDLIDKNVQSLWLNYARQMGGDTALRRLGITNRQELSELRAQVVKELTDEAGNLVKGADRALNNFDASMADLLGINTKLDPNSKMWQGTRVANNLVRSAKLGATWFAMAAEVGQASHRVGYLNMLQSMPAMKQIIRKLRGKDAGKMYDEIQAWEAIGAEIHDLPSSARWDEQLVQTSKGNDWLSKLERGSDLAAEATYLLGGVKSGTATIEHLFASANRVKMNKIANKKRLSKKDYWYMEQFGFDKDTAKEVLSSIKQFSDPKNKYIYNLDSWDADLANKFAMGVRRQSNLLIQKGRLGDQIGVGASSGALVKDTMLGALAMNLRSFMLMAYNKQLSRGVVRMTNGGQDAYDTLGLWSASTIGAFLGYVGKQYATKFNDKEELDKALEPERIAANTFNMTSWASILPNVIDPIATATTGENLFSGGGARGTEINPLGATGQYLFKDLPNAIDTVGGLLSPYNDVSQSQVERTLGMLPLSTFVGVKNVTSEVAEALSEK